MMRKLAGLLLATLVLTAPALAQDTVPEPENYRTDNYRAPVPATLSGGRVLSTAEAEAIWRSHTAAFIDVLPRPPKPPNLPAGTVWRDKPRRDIPGSLWLPDTGYGTLAEATEDYFRQGLARASGGDKTKLLVVYCQASCWMSWNAAKRALADGYSNVAWYPEGTDGWEAADLPVVESQPEPRGGEAALPGAEPPSLGLTGRSGVPEHR
jgi:PQQ-dependent catabolism-associated CXXCW motif protein